MVIRVITGIAVAVTALALVLAGLMRTQMFPWGSSDEQRIATSNKILVGAAIGLVIILLSVILGNQIPSWFASSSAGCPLSSRDFISLYIL
jgi:hypothetical protein